MIITEILARNARMYGNETALIERAPAEKKRTEFTWSSFDDQANQVAQALMARGIARGQRVVHLMMNSIEWLPCYFGILRTGAWAVPLNFRFVAKTILRCTETAEARAMIFGEEFIDRINEIKIDLDRTVRFFIFVGPVEKTPALVGNDKRRVGSHFCSEAVRLFHFHNAIVFAHGAVRNDFVGLA